MADLRHWYTGQLVTAQEMRGGDTALEQGTFDLATDMEFVGLISGGNVVEHAGTPNMTVDVAAFLARSPLGERIRAAGLSNVDCAFDSLEQPTAVTTPGNSRFVDIYAVFDRIGSDPRIDATNNTVFFIQSESFAFEVVQGAEAASPAAPAGPNDGVLLARVTLTFGQTTITDPSIDTTVKESVVKLTSGSLTIEAGTFVDALGLLLAEYEAHVSGSGSHQATAIVYNGGPNWADGSTNPSATVEVQLDKIVSDLVLTTSGQSGAHKVGCANSSSWADGTSIAGTTIYALANGIITGLASSAGGVKIGRPTVSGSPSSLSTTSVGGQISELLTLTNARARIASAETITAAWSFTTGDIAVPRISPGYVDLGTLTNGGHLTLSSSVGVVKFKTPGTNSAYLTITLDPPSDTSKRPLIRFRMLGNSGFTSQVYFVAPAEAGTGSFGLPPTNYYGFFAGGSANNGHLEFIWNGSKWEIALAEGNNVSQSGGGTYA